MVGYPGGTPTGSVPGPTEREMLDDRRGQDRGDEGRGHQVDDRPVPGGSRARHRVHRRGRAEAKFNDRRRDRACTTSTRAARRTGSRAPRSAGRRRTRWPSLIIAELDRGRRQDGDQGRHHQGRDQRRRDHRLREGGAARPRPRRRSRRARRSRRTPTAARWAPTSSSSSTTKGVPPHRIIIGHCCGTSDHDYHMKIVARRLVHGLRPLRPRRDPPRRRARVVALEADQEAGDLADRRLARHGLVLAGRADRGPEAPGEMEKVWTPSHFTRRIVPRLLAGGATKEDIDKLLDREPAPLLRRGQAARGGVSQNAARSSATPAICLTNPKRPARISRAPSRKARSASRESAAADADPANADLAQLLDA